MIAASTTQSPASDAGRGKRPLNSAAPYRPTNAHFTVEVE